MTKLLNTLPVATLLVVAGFIIVALVGGVVTIVHPESLSFDKYAALVTGLAGSAGLLGVGRGINSTATAKVLTDGAPLPADSTGKVPPPA